MSRFQIVEKPALAPACSLFSRTYQDKWFIDCGMQIDEGAVYIGELDFRDMAKAVGYVSPETHAKLIKMYTELLEEHNAILSASDRSNAAVDLLFSALKEFRSTRAAINSPEPTVAGTSKGSAK